MKILINSISTKKITGGAYQIALNFLLKSLQHPEIEWLYVTSQDVDDVIGDRFAGLKGKKYFVFPTQPDFRGTYKKVKRELKLLEMRLAPDLVYSITAPSYFSFKTPEVMRFTNPWVTHPNKYSWGALSLTERFRYYLYGLNQKRLMKASHYFITQTTTCAEGIMRITREPEDHIKVVSNVLPDSFKTSDNTPIREDMNINVAAVGAAIPHKNLIIIPEVLRELAKIGINNVRFHLTLAPDSQVAKNINDKLEEYGLNDHVINHGRMTQKSLGEMYRRCQFSFIPTLLEVFSASILEAMYFKLPVVATRFDFNSEILEDACLYYEPKNAVDAAHQLAKLISDSRLQDVCIRRMQKLLLRYGDYDSHFNDIEDYLVDVTNKVSHCCKNSSGGGAIYCIIICCVNKKRSGGGRATFVGRSAA